MSAILRNRFVNWVAALTALLWAFTWMPRANAQDADRRITGSCTPHTPEQGPWDCKILKVIRPVCTKETTDGHDEAWKSVHNDDDAVSLLKTMYLKMGGPIQFTEWLSCQGFSHVQVFSPSVIFGTTRVEGVSVHIGVSYSPKESPFPVPLWAYFFAYGAHYEIDIDDFGQIKKMNYNYEAI